MSKKQVKAVRTIGESEVRNLDQYEVVTSANGNRSLDCADATAKALRGKTLHEAIKLLARALKTAGIAEGSLREIEKALVKRYGHLNPGLARMSVGNKLRGAK